MVPGAFSRRRHRATGQPKHPETTLQAHKLLKLGTAITPSIPFRGATEKGFALQPSHFVSFVGLCWISSAGHSALLHGHFRTDCSE
jgi:hypothetical protein